jgi:hypothetical protein
MLWLINQATAGELSLSGAGGPSSAASQQLKTLADEEKKGVASGAGPSFNDIKIDMNA